MSRVREMDPRRLDLYVGLFILVEAQLELLIGLGDEVADGKRALAHVALLMPGIALMLRTRAPLTAMTVGMACFAATSWMGEEVNENVALPFFALFVVTFSLAVIADTRRLVAGVVIASVLITVAIATDPGGAGAGDALFGFVLFIAAPMLAGRALRNRLELGRALRSRAQELESERGRAAEEAALEERQRIAGELHDLVSHALSGMVVQAAGARRLAGRDPAQARDAFAAIEGSGREALTEMRRLLGVLRREDEEIALAPQPSLTHLSTLVRRAEAGGLAVALAVDGDPRPLSVGADVIAYRVVQEALRGALDSGRAGHADVRVRYREGAVDIEVSDDGHGERPLLGIRERVALYGGELVAGQRRAGGHLVRASLPATEPA